MPLHITIANAGIRYRFVGTVRFFNKSKIGLKLHLNGLKENIEYIRTTFACADRWSHSFENLHQDGLLHGIHTLVKFGLNGYLKMIKMLLLFQRGAFVIVRSMLLYSVCYHSHLI